MKTKFILTAMCLPLAFAACTNEEVFVENNQSVLEGKQVIDLKVAATYGADAVESRMVNNNGTFLWEGTDVLGAAWNTGGNIYSNNKFVNTLTEASATADFTTQATTVVGNYVFYYPYNTAVTKDLNSGIVYSLPEPQLYDPTGEKMMENNFMISPNIKVDGNEPGELTLPLTMRSIYAYGQLNLTLPEVLVVEGSNVNSVKIQKIIINVATSNTYKNGKIAVNSLPLVDLTAENIETLIAGESDNDDLNEACEGKTEAEVRAILFAAADKALTAQTNSYKDGQVNIYTAGTTRLNQVSITCVSEENPDGITLSKNGTFSTRVLLPTANNTDVTIKVYTNQGVWTKTLKNQKIKANHTANLANLNRESNGASSFKMDEFATETGTINTISEADFIASVKILKNDATVTVGDFVLTPAAVAAIPADVKITFDSNVMFGGDMALKNMNFNQNAYLTSGNIELGEAVTYESNVVISNGAEVTITSNDIAANGSMYNYGKLTIDAVDEDGEEASVTFNNTLRAYQYEENDVVELIVNSPVIGSISMNELVDGEGQMTLVNNSTIEKLDVMGENYIVNNNGVIETLFNSGVVNNAGTINDGTNGLYGKINQLEGGVILSLYNQGKIVTVAKSETTAENAGEIVYVEGARVSAKEGNGDVNYIAPSTFAATDFSSLNSSVTKVTFENAFSVAADANLKTANTNIKALEFKSDLSVTSGKTLTLNDNTTISFTGASSVVKGGTITGVNVAIVVGVAETNTTDAVDTDVEIKKNTTIENVTSVIFNTSKAQVWNDGTVYGSQTAQAQWKSEKITVKPASAN